MYVAFPAREISRLLEESASVLLRSILRNVVEFIETNGTAHIRFCLLFVVLLQQGLSDTGPKRVQVHSFRLR